MDSIGPAMVIIFLIVVYMIPTFTAISNDHRNKAGIFVLNLFLGWSLVGWVAALVWAISKGSDEDGHTRITDNSEHQGVDVYSKIERLSALKEKGALTQEEFDKEKAKLLS
ncbi:hypothetical protein R84981_002756 [Carnimonas sp. R-84981]|uniref:superinfection immunity protein n=1 Tax=Carnimonas bestiolae TaxID=3402172 RepID=UPI003EDC2BDA